MHLTILVIGSQGDVRPCVALGTGLRRAGHAVRIATAGSFAELVQSQGFDFAPIHGDPREAMESTSGQAWLQSGSNLVRFMRGLRNVLTPEDLEKTLADMVEACRGTEAILFTPLAAPAFSVAERMDLPCLYLLLQPFSRTCEEPALLAPTLPLGGRYNWWTHLLAEQLFWQTFRVPINRWRRESLKLDPLPFKGAFDLVYQNQVPFLYGFSRSVVPRARDWPDWHHITGYWFMDDAADWRPPPELVSFLADGPQPICIGFGSMGGRTAQRMIDLAVEAVTMSKQRAVLLGGWATAGQRPLPEDIYAITAAPHEWLFQRVAAVVHHGGAGTTAAGLRAGRPSVITPFFGDQPYWGRRVYALGIGPRAIPRARLTAPRLAAAITQATTDLTLKAQAAAIGQMIVEEDGVARAVELVNHYVGG